MNQPDIDFLQKSRDFLDLTHSLATGPNEYSSQFGMILEGVFRKDYLTLETTLYLAERTHQEPGCQLIFGGSILDLSRRVLEDMVYMSYIAENGKEKYSRRFRLFSAVEQKMDLDFMKRMGLPVVADIEKEINEGFSKVPSKLKDRDNWAGQSVEMVIEDFVKNGKITDHEKEILLKVYLMGNRKNHTSSIDIMSHSRQDALEGFSKSDLQIGIATIYFCTLKIALQLIDELKNQQHLTSQLEKHWTDMGGKLSV